MLCSSRPALCEHQFRACSADDLAAITLEDAEELAKLDAVEPMDVDVVPSPDSSTASESMASPLCAKVLAF